jgi:hypothetical protein
MNISLDSAKELWWKSKFNNNFMVSVECLSIAIAERYWDG